MLVSLGLDYLASSNQINLPLPRWISEMGFAKVSKQSQKEKESDEQQHQNTEAATKPSRDDASESYPPFHKRRQDSASTTPPPPTVPDDLGTKETAQASLDSYPSHRISVQKR